MQLIQSFDLFVIILIQDRCQCYNPGESPPTGGVGGDTGVCGVDALAVDIKDMYPSSYFSNPCVIAKKNAGYTPANDHLQHFSRVAPGAEICASWHGNGHTGDAMRNVGGGVRYAISAHDNPRMDQFETITYMPYGLNDAGGGMFRVPEKWQTDANQDHDKYRKGDTLAPGNYTMLFEWRWPRDQPGPAFMIPFDGWYSLSKGRMLRDGEDHDESLGDFKTGIDKTDDFIYAHSVQ